jgi:isopenicillin-N N-acyltransferase-like protein
MNDQPIRLLELSGSPYQRGFQHGNAYRDDIRRYAAERVHLVCGGAWSGGANLSREQVLALAEACLPAHEAYSAPLVDELRGMSDATGLSLGELIVAGGFTDFIDTVYDAYRPEAMMGQPVDDCTAFIVPDTLADGKGFFGQTWDMHDTATEFVILLRILPMTGPRSLVFTTTGCVGQIGMNSAGICVGINNLMGADGQIGVTWPFVVRKVLQQDNIEDALACITEAQLAGSHNYLLFDAEGNGYNVEAMSSTQVITKLNGEALVHTNHCLVPETIAYAQVRPAASQASSEARLKRGQQLLATDEIDINDLIALTRDEEAICVMSQPPFHVESCGAAIMRPKTGDFWAVWGLPKENEYEHFVV